MNNEPLKLSFQNELTAYGIIVIFRMICQLYPFALHHETFQAGKK